jgi:DNA-binding NarL/FixJ family response regulator
MVTLRAFLVEDSSVVRESIIGALEELAPIKIVGVADSEPAAEDWLQENAESCDLLLVDIQLRLGSGLGVLRSASVFRRPMALVVLTNYATAHMREHCVKLGADRVFDKSKEFEPFLEYCVRLANGETGPAELGGPGAHPIAVIRRDRNRRVLSRAAKLALGVSAVGVLLTPPEFYGVGLWITLGALCSYFALMHIRGGL